MKPKRYVQRKLNFDTYIAHYAFGPDPAEERQRQREEHLKRIHITYQPKTLHPKRVTANPVESEDEPWSIIYVNGKYQPWGNLPETYSGQHEGKPFGQPYVINIGNTMYDPFFEPDWKTKHSKEINDYLSSLLKVDGKNGIAEYASLTESQQQRVYANVKEYRRLCTEVLQWKIPMEIEQFWNQISEN